MCMYLWKSSSPLLPTHPAHAWRACSVFNLWSYQQRTYLFPPCRWSFRSLLTSSSSTAIKFERNKPASKGVGDLELLFKIQIFFLRAPEEMSGRRQHVVFWEVVSVKEPC